MSKLRAWILPLLLFLLVVPTSFVAFAQTDTPTPTATPDYRTFVQVGAIELLAGTPPDSSSGWLICDGSEVSRTDYAQLFAAIGTTFGAGDGVNTFNLPDLRGRVPVGSGAGAGLTARTLGQIFGEETHALTVTEMPSHTHTINDPGHDHRARVGNGASAFILTAAGGSNPTVSNGLTTGTTPNMTGSNTTGITVNSTGGGAAFNQMQPSVVVNYVIWSGAVAMPGITDDEIVLTVVVVFPTHTPTPTPTPTLTPTDGPSPTPTATITPTINTDVGYTVGSQTVLMKYEVRPAESIGVAIGVGVFILMIVLVYYQMRRKE